MRTIVLLATLIAASKHASAWVANPSSSVIKRIATTAFPRTTTAALQASVEEETETKTEEPVMKLSDVPIVPLEPEYEMALEQAKAKLAQMIPEKYHSLLPMLNHFVMEYTASSQIALQDGNPVDVVGPSVAVNRIVTGIGYGLKFGMGEKAFKFDVSHSALRGKPEEEDGNTIDFYKFGCDFFRPYMNFNKSVILGQDNLEKAVEQIKNGENVVFFANHQSEADPQVVSCCLERIGCEKLAEDMVYVAGHKVTTDPLAIPFSMGRNLLCIHSKKHINTDPATKPQKQKQNLRSMNKLLIKLKQGGTAIWVAPSGGRDRRDLESGEVPLAPFDSKTIDIFRLMGNKSRTPTHYYTLAMVTYDMCPPPDYVVPGVGEERNIRYVPVGLNFGNELENEGGLDKRHEFCDMAFEQCNEDYHALMHELGKE